MSKNLERIYEGKWLERFNRAALRLNQSDSTEESIATIDDPAHADSMRFVVSEMRRMSKEALRHCSILKPDDFRAYSTRGLIYQRQGNVDSSLADFSRAESLFHRYELEDSTTNWHDTSAFFAGPEGEPTSLFKDYQKAYKKLSDEKRMRYRNMLVSLSGAYYDSEMWLQTIAISRRFYGLEPDDINNIVTMADVFARLGRDDEAFKWQETVVRRDPGSKDTWYNMGIFYYNTAVRLQDSVLKYEQEVRNDPKDEAAASAFQDYSRKRLENFFMAVPRFQKVVEIDPKDKDTWRLLATCDYSVASLADDLQAAGDSVIVTEVFDPEGYDRERHWARAEETLGKAAEYFPDGKNLCRMMRVTLAQLGKIDEMEDWRERCP
jgi:tetratricopeptide (TPR) repeat protein